MPFARFPGDHSPLKRLRSLVSCPPPESHTFGGCTQTSNVAQHEPQHRRRATVPARRVRRTTSRRSSAKTATAAFVSGCDRVFMPDEGEKSGEHDADGAVEGRGQRACGACDESCDLIQHHGCPDKRWEVGGAHCRCLTKESACARQKYRNLAIWGLRRPHPRPPTMAPHMAAGSGACGMKMV